MVIPSLLLAGGAMVGYSSIEQYAFNRKRFRKNKHRLGHKLTTNSVFTDGKPHLDALLKQVDDNYQLLIHSTVDRLFGTDYEKHLQALDGTSGIDAIPPMIKQHNRQAGYAVISFIFALAGTFFFVAASFAINLYLGYVFMKLGIQDMKQRRRLTARGLNTIVYLSMMVSGFLAVQSAMFVVGFLFEKLIATVQGHSHERLVNVFGELPQTVSRLHDGDIVSCPLEAVRAGDVVVVYAGEVVPVDGDIILGHASIDQHALTGEAQPVEKEAGDSVLASTLVLMGEIQVQVRQANADTLAAQITDILNNTHSHHTQVALSGLELADKSTLAKMALGLVAWPFAGISTTFAVWSVPLGTALLGTTPLTLMAYLDMAARSNILIKDGRSLELLSSIDTVVFDKTGTLTEEQPTVCSLHPCGDLKDHELLALAAAIEQRQSHPIALAIREAAEAQVLTLPQVDDTRIEVGYGLAVILDDQKVLLGSQRYMILNDVLMPKDIRDLTRERQSMGYSMVYLAAGGVLQGVIELQPTVRPEALATVNALHERGFTIAMITGDQETPALALAENLGIDRVFANVLPEQKADLVQDLQEEGHQVMFVGDGINDSIALKQAHVSVSIMGATTVATDTAQIVLMDGTLLQLDTLFDLAQHYERDLRTQFILGVHVPVAHIGLVLLLGLGVLISYTIGIIAALTALAIAFRPIWRQEQLESKQQGSLTQPGHLQLSD